MNTVNQLPPELNKALRRETQGEIIRWSGRPNPMAAFRATLPIWIMGVPWSAIMFTIMATFVVSVLNGKPPTRTVPVWEYAMAGAVFLFISVFVLIGLAMLLAPFWAWWQARNTIHVITSDRLLTLIAGRKLTTRSIPPHQILRIERQQRKDGSGTLRVTTGFKTDSDGDKIELTEDLIGVPKVAAAERHLVDLAPHCAA